MDRQGEAGAHDDEQQQGMAGEGKEIAESLHR
jgi:hypothetical protein